MPTRHPHEAAARLAGELYGRILNRNADRDGYDYVLDSLREGKKSVRQHALEMIASAEFTNQFVNGGGPQSAARVLNKVLLGRDLGEPLLKFEAEKYVRIGRERYAEQLTQSEEYRRLCGEDRVPWHGH